MGRELISLTCEVCNRRYFDSTAKEQKHWCIKYINFLRAIEQRASDKTGAIHVAFISGLISNTKRHRLLEKETLALATAFDQTRAREQVSKCAKTYLKFQKTFREISFQ